MSATCLLVRLVGVSGGRAAPPPDAAYDDRAMIDKVLASAGELIKLVPRANSASSRAAEFKSGRIPAKLARLKAHVSAVRGALRRRGDPSEIVRHRMKMADLAGRLVTAIEIFGRNAASLASVNREMAAHKRKKPNC